VVVPRARRESGPFSDSVFARLLAPQYRIRVFGIAGALILLGAITGFLLQRMASSP
jgi:hypothetical protein